MRLARVRTMAHKAVRASAILICSHSMWAAYHAPHVPTYDPGRGFAAYCSRLQGLLSARAEPYPRLSSKLNRISSVACYDRSVVQAIRHEGAHASVRS